MNPACFAPPIVLSYVLKFPIPVDCSLSLIDLSSAPSAIQLSTYLFAFALTCLLEAPIYGILFALRRRELRSLTAAVVFVNLCTHPIVIFILPTICAKFQIDYGNSLLIAEIFAPLTEAALLFYVWKFSARDSLLTSIAANLFSWWLGVYLVALLGIA